MSGPTIADTKQYLSFKLDSELFGIEVFQVRELLEFVKITRVPRSPEFMRGVINVRGTVVPVMDIKLKFGLGKTEPTINTCIIVLELSLDGEQSIIGVLADSVQEVFELAPDKIEPAPKIGRHLRTEFIKGIGNRDENFFIILDVDMIFTDDELADVREASESPEAFNPEGSGNQP